MAETQETKGNSVAPLFRAALIFALAWAGWSVYRQLPESPSPVLGDERREESTRLRVILRRPPGYERKGEERTRLQIYPISVEAARREFLSERRPGVTEDEFVVRRMGAREPIAVEFDESDEAIVEVPQGRWWIHVDLEGPYEMAWRLPVNVSGRDKTVELNFDNRYTRTKSF